MRPSSRSPNYKFMIRGPDPYALEKLSNLAKTLLITYFYYVKVGITNNPETRWKRHQQEDPRWEDLVVAYETGDRTEVKKLERRLTEIYNLENIKMGGGGPNPKGKQYLYFLAAKRYNMDFKRTSPNRFGFYK